MAPAIRDARLDDLPASGPRTAARCNPLSRGSRLELRPDVRPGQRP